MKPDVRYRLPALVVALGLALALLLAGCGGGDPETPEGQVRALLAELEVAAEAADVGAIKDHVSERYADDYGNDKQSLAAYLTFQVMRSQRRHVVLRVREVLIRDGGLAQVTLHAGLAGTGGDLTRADVYAVDLDLEDEDGEWRLVWAQWKRAAPTDLL